ncbi:MAG TPA: glycosyltransferase family A protein [Rhodocyclaceae bacterium]|nr:glycosyltransferase family A protein [Rhodocyclaceae bacterium]
MHTPAPAKPLAPVAVIVPMLDEAATLPALLDALASQTVRLAELVFVDAGSHDASVSLVQDWWSNHGWPDGYCLVLSVPGALPGAGRNRGLAASTATRIAFVDAGLWLEPVWLERMIAALDRSAADSVYARCRFEGVGVLGTALCGLSYGHGAQRPTLVGSLFERNAVLHAGAFVEHLRAGEDVRWTQAFDLAGGKRVIADEVLIHYHHFPKSLHAAIRKWQLYERHAVLAGVGGKSRALSAALLALALLGCVLPHAGGLTLLYLLGRGVLDPARRSSWSYWFAARRAVLLAVFLAPILDIAKLWGAIEGYRQRRFVDQDTTSTK